MTSMRERLAIAAALMLMASPAFAQTTSGGTAASTSTSTTGSFSSLSSGNQKIARALFLAQQPTQNGPQPLSLDQIAARKSDEGWGKVFNEMKAEGLVQEKNLGEVVSGYEHHLHSASTSSSGRTVVTTGSGRSFATGSDHGHAETGKDGDVAMGDDAGHGDASARNPHDVDTGTVGGVTTGAGSHAAGGASVSSAGGGMHGGGAAHAH